MNIYKEYKLLIIGGGISGSVFASNYLKNNPNDKIALVESGRKLGGRGSTRLSRNFKDFEINHGAPNLNICNTKSNNLLNNFIDELINNRLIRIDDSDSIEIRRNKCVDIKKRSEFSIGQSYLPLSSMSNLSHNIIAKNNIRDQIDFYFETLIIDLKFKENKWVLRSRNGDLFKSKFVILASNLLLHTRSREILNLNQVPLRKAIPKNNDKEIDLLLETLEKQSFIPRLSFMIYTKSNYNYKDSYSKKYRYFYLNNQLQNKFKFERVIFQLQKNRNLSIVIHSRSNELIESFKKKNLDEYKQEIIIKFNNLFKDNKFINQLSERENFSIMRWRASQPAGIPVDSSLQFCRKYNIGFCGDWFKEEGFGRIEGAILSALKLANNFKSIN